MVSSEPGDLVTTRDEALEFLAQRLHLKMEHLDPSKDHEWGNLSERKKEFFRICIKSIFQERRIARIALDN